MLKDIELPAAAIVLAARASTAGADSWTREVQVGGPDLSN